MDTGRAKPQWETFGRAPHWLKKQMRDDGGLAYGATALVFSMAIYS